MVGAEGALYDGLEEDPQHRRESFVKIYENNWWFSNISKSGTGSERTHTVKVEKVLDKVVEKVKSVMGKEVIRLDKAAATQS